MGWDGLKRGMRVLTLVRVDNVALLTAEFIGLERLEGSSLHRYVANCRTSKSSRSKFGSIWVHTPKVPNGCPRGHRRLETAAVSRLV